MTMDMEGFLPYSQEITEATKGLPTTAGLSPILNTSPISSLGTSSVKKTGTAFPLLLTGGIAHSGAYLMASGKAKDYWYAENRTLGDLNAHTQWMSGFTNPNGSSP